MSSCRVREALQKASAYQGTQQSRRTESDSNKITLGAGLFIENAGVGPLRVDEPTRSGDGSTSRTAGRGDPSAFAELYDACADRVHHYLVVRLGSRADADDVLQETFVRLARTRKRLATVENLWPTCLRPHGTRRSDCSNGTPAKAGCGRPCRRESLFQEAAGR